MSWLSWHLDAKLASYKTILDLSFGSVWVETTNEQRFTTVQLQYRQRTAVYNFTSTSFSPKARGSLRGKPKG